MNRDYVIRAIQTILQSSEYFDYVYRNFSQIGFKIGNEAIIMNLDYESSKIDFRYLSSFEGSAPQLWIIVQEQSLLDFAFQQQTIENLKLQNPGTSQPPINPALERIVLRCFENHNKIQHSKLDREELIYASLFSFTEPQIIWQQEELDVKVLKYANSLNGLDVYVTSGFSNPENGNSPSPMEEDNLIGFGYELILLSPPNTSILGQQLTGWAQYVINTGSHILRDNLLEYEEGIIPGTDLSGFLIVAPNSFPDYFPLFGGICYWNLLLGVTKEELDMAKNIGVESVVEHLFDSGYGNHTPIQRKSVIR